MTLPEVLMWNALRGSPLGIRFRHQHGAGDYVLDFFCARANLAIEIDGISHAMWDRPMHDEARDAWLRERRIETIRMSARDVLSDVGAAVEAIVATAADRLERFGKAPPSSLRDATSPSQVDGEDRL